MRFANLTTILGFFLTAAIGKAAIGQQSNDSSELFLRLDANRDGAISSAEIRPEHGRLFRRLLHRADENADQSLTPSEFAAGLMPVRHAKPLVTKASGDIAGAEEIRLLLVLMDTNQDTIIDQNEVPIELLDVFDQMVEMADRNRDDRLSRSELARAGGQLAALARRVVRSPKLGAVRERDFKLPAPGQLARRFNQLDANRDGQLSREELPASLQERFTRLLRLLDRDLEDGLSRQDLLRAAVRLRRLLADDDATTSPERSSRPAAAPTRRSRSR